MPGVRVPLTGLGAGDGEAELEEGEEKEDEENEEEEVDRPLDSLGRRNLVCTADVSTGVAQRAAGDAVQLDIRLVTCRNETDLKKQTAGQVA